MGNSLHTNHFESAGSGENLAFSAGFQGTAPGPRELKDKYQKESEGRSMEILVRVVSTVLIVVVLSLLAATIRRSNAKKHESDAQNEHIVVQLPRPYLWVGYVVIAVALAGVLLMIFVPKYAADPTIWILCILFGILGAVILLATYVWKIELFKNESYFIYRTALFAVYQVQYDDCLSYKLGRNELLLYTAKKKFRIDCNTVNFECLLDMLTQHEVKQETQ